MGAYGRRRNVQVLPLVRRFLGRKLNYPNMLAFVKRVRKIKNGHAYRVALADYGLGKILLPREHLFIKPFIDLPNKQRNEIASKLIESYCKKKKVPQKQAAFELAERLDRLAKKIKTGTDTLISLSADFKTMGEDYSNASTVRHKLQFRLNEECSGIIQMRMASLAIAHNS